MKNKSIFHIAVQHCTLYNTEKAFRATPFYRRLSLRLLNQKWKNKIEKNQEEIKY